MYSELDGSPRHGLGLALARQVARRHGGDVELLAASGADHGAVFLTRMSGVLAVPASRVHA